MQLTVLEVAQYLKVTEKTVYRWIRESRIPHHEVDGQYRFNRTEILEWANERKHRVSTAIYRRDKAPGATLSFSECLEAGGVVHRLPGREKDEVLRAMVDALPLPADTDRETLFQVLLARERLGSTGVGHGIAIPHVRSPIVMAVESPLVMLFFLDQAIDFGSPDGQPVKTLIWLVSPSVHLHAHMLARIASLIRDAGFLSALERQAPAAEILNEARRAEAALDAQAPAKS